MSRNKTNETNKNDEVQREMAGMSFSSAIKVFIKIVTSVCTKGIHNDLLTKLVLNDITTLVYKYLNYRFAFSLVYVRIS